MFSVGVTFKNGREAGREFSCLDDARRYYGLITRNPAVANVGLWSWAGEEPELICEYLC